MIYRKLIHNYVQSHRNEIISTLKELVRIPSVKGQPSQANPNGVDCANVLNHIQQLYAKYGFETELDKEGGYLLSYFGEGKRTLGIFAHADVVPVSDDWIFTKPFDPIELDGCLVGRGVLDDKSAVVASLYCARMFRELDLPFSSRLIMFTGSCEESGMADIKNYLSKHIPPAFSLVPDTAFPLYHGNKGRILLRVCRDASLGEVRSFNGGKHGTNTAEATASLAFSDTVLEHLKTFESECLSIRADNDKITLTAVGVAKHTALPEGSVNAAALIANVLRSCPALSEDTRLLFDFIYGVCSDYYGGYLDINSNDPELGRLTFVNYQIQADDVSSELYFNIRFGASVNTDEIKVKLRERFAQYGFTVEVLNESLPHIVPADHPVLHTILDTYKAFTGDTDAKMYYINAGGTYAQYLPCAAEIGTTLRWNKPVGTPSGHGAVHQPDEAISIDGMIESIELTAHILLACDNILNQ
jgi:succinyl-diaminopimelate desuccinylase